MEIQDSSPPSPGARRRRSVWTWVALGGLLAVILLLIVAEVMLQRAGPILKGRVEETLSTRFNSRVELGSLDVSLLRGLEVTGADLRIFPPDSVVAAGATQPLIAISRFSFHSGLAGLFFTPTRVRKVYVTGMAIHIPPKEMRQQAPEKPKEKQKGKIEIVVEEIVCDQSRLIIGTAQPNKDPKDFELRHIELHEVGPDKPWKYDATLSNAIPRGEIHATGTFGPWQTDSPGDSTVTGHYNFDRADLNTIKGIGGTLSSVGDFQGQLNRIVVDGTTETPDFSLDTASHGVPLHTRFHAIVDGTSGDTYLQPVEAKLRNSSFTTSGSVINIKGQGHRIELDVDIPAAQLRDFLDLAVKTQPAVMTGTITTKAKLQIRPGKDPVPQKLAMQGAFALRGIRFTNTQVQDKVDMLSQRAKGDPEKAKPGAQDVNSQMKGRFVMASGALTFSDLAYSLPGARVNLDGLYSLDGQQFDFRGKVFTAVPLSRMVESPWKSLLLKAVNPFFKSKSGGSEIPVRIEGTKSEPKFGLDVMGDHKQDGNSRPDRK